MAKQCDCLLLLSLGLSLKNIYKGSLCSYVIGVSSTGRAVGRFCSNLTNHVPTQIAVPGNQMWLAFVSDGSVVHQGFNISYQFARKFISLFILVQYILSIQCLLYLFCFVLYILYNFYRCNNVIYFIYVSFRENGKCNAVSGNSVHCLQFIQMLRN